MEITSASPPALVIREPQLPRRHPADAVSGCAATPLLAPSARYAHSVRWRLGSGPAVVAGALQELRTVGAGRDRGELRGAGSADSGVLLGHVLDDVEFRLALAHQPACGLAGVDRTGSVVKGDAGLGERVQEARVNTRIGAARIGVRRHAHTQCGGDAEQHQDASHRSIIAHVGAAVVSAPRTRETPHSGSHPAKIRTVAEKIEVQRKIAAPPTDIFAVLCDPQGHVAIDSTGMLQDAEGGPVAATGDSFVVHMDRDSLNDYPELGKYDVTVSIRDFEADRLISWTVLGQIRPQIGHVYGYRLEPDEHGEGTLVTSFYDWSQIDDQWREAGIFPVISELALRATLGILDRTVRRGYPEG